MIGIKKTNVFFKNLFLVITVALFVTITFFLFGPLEIFMTQSNEFWFDVSDMIKVISISSFACFLGMLLIFYVSSLLGEKFLLVVTSFFAALGLGLYIQGNWMFVNYGEMNGTFLVWDDYLTWAIVNTIIWLAIIVTVMIFFNKSQNIRKKFIYVLLFIIGIEIITLLVLTCFSTNENPETNFFLVGGNEFKLSKNKNNIIVFCADSFDGSLLLPVLAEEPELKEYFDGFTLYENTIGTSVFSEESIITLLTGNQLEVGLTFDENIKKAYEKTDLYDTLEKNNYDTYLYSDEKVVSSSIKNKIQNMEIGKAGISDLKTAFMQTYKMVAFRYVPHIFKKFFWYSTSDFYEFKGERWKLFANEDMYKYLTTGGVTAEDTEKNIYQCFWFIGAHYPVCINRYCQWTETVELGDESYNEAHFEQIIGVVRIFTELIKQLKENDIYDNTTIIITADHGFHVVQNPLLLIKPFNEHGELKVSEVPVSMVFDYIPTLKYFISGDKVESTIYELEEGQERIRPFYVYDINNDISNDRIYNDITLHEHQADVLNINCGLGEELTPINIYSHAKVGFENPFGEDRIRTIGKECILNYKIEEEFDDLELEMNYLTEWGKSQIQLYVNDKLISDFIAMGEETKTFRIPGEYVQDGKLQIKFILPDAIAPSKVDNSSDDRLLSMNFYSMKLSNVSSN